MKYDKAPEIKTKIDQLIDQLSLLYIKKDSIFCIRSYNVKTRAIARIWGIGKLFSEVIGIKTYYIIEVNSKRFDKLSEREKTKTLIHELMHIPKTFSGALLSHRGRYHHINNREVEKIMKKLKK